MTLEQLLASDAKQLEKLTDLELKEFFKPYLTVTRPSPEEAKKRGTIGESSRVNKTSVNKKQNAMDLLRALAKKKGINLDD